MPFQAGTIIKSTEALNGTYFEAASIIITEFNDNGAVGFIINRLWPRQLNELQEFKNTPFVLYEGGPVEQDHLFFVHKRPDIVEGGVSVRNNLYYGGNFKQVVDGINQNLLSTSNLKIFVGYCGWNTSELEAEIEDESWEITTGIGIF
jgi:putative transcriptional regulator